MAISTGDFERAGGSASLTRSNVLVLTNEKMDALIRHGAKWLDDIGVVIADEVHLIGDAGRAPRLRWS